VGSVQLETHEARVTLVLMPIIELTTEVRAPVERVFDLARSIDLHVKTASGTNERAVSGVTTGLIGPDQEVTWEARHFGLLQRLTVRINEYDRPRKFRDSMVRGIFRRLDHEHLFEERGDITRMVDKFDFASPMGILGQIGDRLFLTDYLKKFLIKRGEIIKTVAETGEWQQFL
jgi:ligand-binding SRPBCC domain-containing protein